MFKTETLKFILIIFAGMLKALTLNQIDFANLDKHYIVQ